MKRKNHFVLFGVLLLALINLSPSLPETSTSGSQRESGGGAAALRGGESEKPLREIEVYTMMASKEFEVLQAVNAEYERRSGTAVNLVNVAPEQAYLTYREVYAVGREPDVLMLDGTWVADFAAAGRLLPADLYEAGVAAASDSLPLPAASVEWNGYRWAVPLDLDPYGAVWSPQQFEGTSGELPQSTETWEAWAKSLSVPEKSADLSADAVDPAPAIGFPSGDARAFAALIALWKEADQGEKEENTNRSLELAETLRSRTYLAEVSAKEGQLTADLREKIDSQELDLAVDRLSRLGAQDSPSSRIRPLSFAARTAALRCFGIAANTERAREASLWIAYITGREAQNDWYASTGRLPVLRAVYDEPGSAQLLRWLPDSQTGWSAAEEDVSANPKKAAAREILWSQSIEQFYEGELSVEDLSKHVLP